MAPHLLCLLVLFMFPFGNNGGLLVPPAPGYYPASKVRPIGFNQGYKSWWGSQNQRLGNDGFTMWLNKNSGSGFESLSKYSSGYFGADIKLQPGYTAGVITSFYLSNVDEHPGNHDEIDIEFLGTIPEEPYVLQTNVYMKGSGDGNHIIGREMQFHLWFDPTKDFHNYAILWNPSEIIFFVDDVPIRRYPRKSDATFPQRPMGVYGSVWDASSWATDGGKYKADYRYQPFVGKYKNFRIAACSINGAASCRPATGTATGTIGLSPRQNAIMFWVQKNYKVYDYCMDPKRNHLLTPEC